MNIFTFFEIFRGLQFPDRNEKKNKSFRFPNTLSEQKRDKNSYFDVLYI